MTRRATRFLVLACVLVAAATFSAQGSAQPATTVTVIPWLSTYQYKIVPPGDGAGFENPNASPASFSTGQAGFGDDPQGICFAFLNNPTYTNTRWPSGVGSSSDILLRKRFDLPEGAANAVLTIAIDNDIQVFVNGTNIFDGVHDFCAMRLPVGPPSFIVPVPAAVLDEEDNLLAVRGIDRFPGIASYIDLELTAQCLPDLDDDNDGIENSSEGFFGLLENDADSDDDGILDGNEDSDDDGEDDEDEDDGDECPSDSDGDGEDDEDEDDDDDEDDD